MILNYKISHKITIVIKIMILIISVVLFLSFIHPTFSTDEEYTIGLIDHNFYHLIHINELDVHPATYYVILKFFLQISTFWTNSLFVKILFGRLFSFIAFILSFVILYKIIKLSHINIKWEYQLVCYLLFYSVSLYSTNLRMHIFSSLFNILEYYVLIKFDKHPDNNILLLQIIIYSVVAAYVDYFSAVCAGVFIFIYFIKYVYQHRYDMCIKMMLSGISLIIISIPVIVLMLKQARFRQKFISLSSSSSVNVNTILTSFTQSKSFMIIPFIIAIFWSIRYLNKIFNNYLIYALINFLISNTIAILLCIKVNVYEPKFMYPQFSIYSFFISSILIVIVRDYRNKIIYFIACLFITLLCLLAIKNIAFNVKYYILPSYTLMKKIKNYKNKKNTKNIYLNYNNTPFNTNDPGAPKQIYITQKSLYLFNLHKNLIVINTTPKKMSAILNGKSQLFDKTFTNLKVRNKK